VQELSEHTADVHVQNDVLDGMFTFYDATKSTLNVYQVRVNHLLQILCFISLYKLLLRNVTVEVTSFSLWFVNLQVASVTFDLLFLLVLGSYLIVLFSFLVITTRVWFDSFL
jgi:membrane protein insertase Oxa1/YidC/SpoIIIJ